MISVIYDSNYGNTRQVAEAIANQLGPTAYCMPVDKVKTADLKCDLLIAGCPINGWRPTPKMTAFLKSLSASQLSNIKAAAFDTRINAFFSGNAARKIAALLKTAGATIIAPPQGFYVAAKEGPLAMGEVDKAKKWATALQNAIKS